MNIVVTGGSRGLGLGMVSYFASHGHCVAAMGRSARPQLDEDVLYTQGDVGKAEDQQRLLESALQEFGSIDIWVNNAGVLEPIKPIRDLTVDELETHLRINVGGVLIGSQTFIHYRRHAQLRGGALINISSGASQKGYHGWGAYCAGKAAVDRITETIALEEKEIGLIALSVAPGIIDTEMQALIRQTPESIFPSRPRFVALKEQNRFNSPEFVGDTILNWLSDTDPQTNYEITRRVPEQPT